MLDTRLTLSQHQIKALDGYYRNWLPARDIVVQAMAKRFEVDPSGQILVLDRSCPWTEHLFDLEAGNVATNY